jgi:hypothetical protein
MHDSFEGRRRVSAQMLVSSEVKKKKKKNSGVEFKIPQFLLKYLQEGALSIF